MKKKTFNLKKVVSSLVAIFLASFHVNAQSLEDALGFTETVNDVPEAPIHLLIPILLFVGTYLGIKKLK